MGNQCKFRSHVVNTNNKITSQSLISFVFKLWLLPSPILNLSLNLCFILQSSSLNPTKLSHSRKVTSNPLQNPYSISDGLSWPFRNGHTEQCPSLSWHRACPEVTDYSLRKGNAQTRQRGDSDFSVLMTQLGKSSCQSNTATCHSACVKARHLRNNYGI